MPLKCLAKLGTFAVPQQLRQPCKSATHKLSSNQNCDRAWKGLVYSIAWLKLQLCQLQAYLEVGSIGLQPRLLQPGVLVAKQNQRPWL